MRLRLGGWLAGTGIDDTDGINGINGIDGIDGTDGMAALAGALSAFLTLLFARVREF